MPPPKTSNDIPDRQSHRRNTGHRWRGAIVHQLGSAIAAGEYGLGEQMPNETEGAEALGVSRTAYREAVHYLVAKGMLETRPRFGTRVLPRSKWNLLDPHVLSWLTASDQAEQIGQSLFELADIVAPAAAGIAACRRSRQDMHNLAAAIAATRRTDFGSDARRFADRAFHGTVLRATGNASLIAMTAGIEAAVEWSSRRRVRTISVLHDPVRAYQDVYAAIVEQDAIEATNAMRKLLHRSSIDLIVSDVATTSQVSKAGCNQITGIRSRN